MNDILNVASGIIWMFVVCKTVMLKIKLMLCNQIILFDSFF